MLLIGRYRSPYTRRVAVAMHLLGIPYEHRPITAWSHLDDVRAYNPAGRVPALVLDDGEVLFESAAILDYLDHLAGPEAALLPSAEPERHRVLRVAVCALGGIDKVVAALYAQTMYPAEKVHQPWIDHNEDQVRSALAWLEIAGWAPWYRGGTISQADVTTVVMLEFIRLVAPHLLEEGSGYPQLAGLAERAAELPAFQATLPGSDVPDSAPVLPK